MAPQLRRLRNSALAFPTALTAVFGLTTAAVGDAALPNALPIENFGGVGGVNTSCIGGASCDIHIAQGQTANVDFQVQLVPLFALV